MVHFSKSALGGASTALALHVTLRQLSCDWPKVQGICLLTYAYVPAKVRPYPMRGLL